MNDTHDAPDYDALSCHPAPKPVIIIGGDGYSGAAIQALLADKGFAGQQYEVVSHAEAGERGLLIDDIGEPVFPHPNHESRLDKAAAFGLRYGTSPAKIGRISNPERERWNAAVDEKKAAKRRAKGKP